MPENVNFLLFNFSILKEIVMSRTVMENEKIIEHIVHGLEYYMKTLALPSHMEKHVDKVCSWIKPKEGINNGPEGVYKVNFENMSDKQIRHLVQYYSKRGAPDYWFVSPFSKPDNLRNILAELGKMLNNDMGMAIPPEKMAHAPWRTKYDPLIPVKRVDTKSDFKIWADIVNKTLFDKQIIDPDHYYPLCESGKIICFLGFCGKTPAATSMTLMTDNMSGKLEWIATLLEYRKKGMGTAVCCAGIEQLIKDRARIITLTAREMGISLYETLGFKIYFQFGR